MVQVPNTGLLRNHYFHKHFIGSLFLLILSSQKKKKTIIKCKRVSTARSSGTTYCFVETAGNLLYYLPHHMLLFLFQCGPRTQHSSAFFLLLPLSAEEGKLGVSTNAHTQLLRSALVISICFGVHHTDA
jgi:hypothetical protein